MVDEVCPNCGSTKRRKHYNKWHVKEIYCAECKQCLNQDDVREETRLAEMASREGKIKEFYLGRYKPNSEAEHPDKDNG